MASLSTDPISWLWQDQKQEMCHRHSAKAQPRHLAPRGLVESASTCQHPTPPTQCPCQGLTFEQRTTVSDVMSLVICAEFPVSCPNKRCWHRLPLLGNFLARMLLMRSILSGPPLSVFSWFPIAVLSCGLSTKSMRLARRSPKWRKPHVLQSHPCHQQTQLCPFICP